MCETYLSFFKEKYSYLPEEYIKEVVELYEIPLAEYELRDNYIYGRNLQSLPKEEKRLELKKAYGVKKIYIDNTERDLSIIKGIEELKEIQIEARMEIVLKSSSWDVGKPLPFAKPNEDVEIPYVKNPYAIEIPKKGLYLNEFVLFIELEEFEKYYKTKLNYSFLLELLNYKGTFVVISLPIDKIDREDLKGIIEEMKANLFFLKKTIRLIL